MFDKVWESLNSNYIIICKKFYKLNDKAEKDTLLQSLTDERKKVLEECGKKKDMLENVLRKMGNELDKDFEVYKEEKGESSCITTVYSIFYTHFCIF